jgi:hypothetical protein
LLFFIFLCYNIIKVNKKIFIYFNMPIIIKEYKKIENKKASFSFHKSPLFQKLLIVVLFTAAVSVVYARAATTIGSNISTDGTLTVTGTTTLNSILSVNDINVALSGASDIGLNITGTTGTGIQTTRRIYATHIDGDVGGSVEIDGNANNGSIFIINKNNQEGIVFNPWGSNVTGINWWGGSASSTFIYGYIDYIGAHFDIQDANAIGLKITGTTGTGIQTTRPIAIQPTDGLNYPIIARVSSGGYGITAEGPNGGSLIGNSYGFYVDGVDGSGSSAYAMGNIGASSTAENSFGVFASYIEQGSTGFFVEDTGGTGFKSQHVFANDAAIGFMADKGSSGSGFATLFNADLSNANTKGKGMAITTGNANDIGMDITGTVGIGIQTTRPIKIASSTAFMSEYPLEIVMSDSGYGMTFSENLISAYGIYFPGTLTENSVGVYLANQISGGSRGMEMSGIEDTGVGIMQYLGGYTGDAGRGMEIYFGNNATPGNEGIGLDIFMNSNNALNKGINISGTVGMGMVSTLPVSIGTTTATSSMLNIDGNMEISGDISGSNIELYNGSNLRGGFYADPGELFIYGSPNLALSADGYISVMSPLDFYSQGSKPACDSTIRGRVFYTEGATDDTIEICTQVSSVYAWRSLQ